MNNNIIEWLYNNSSSSNIGKKELTLIECILIISINGVLIEYNSLIEYCNSKIDNEIQLYGLSKQQFQTVYNNIKSLHDNKSHMTTTSSTSPTYNIKFNSSITIINENNNQILNYTNNNIITNKCTNINGNVGDINQLFFRVWRSVVIRNEILFHTRLFNLHLNRVITFKFDELSEYKYKSYCNKLEITNYNSKDTTTVNVFTPNLIKSNVSEISFRCNFKLVENSIPDSTTSVLFYTQNINQTFNKDILPNNITNLYFGFDTQFNQSFSGSWLPNSLLSLTIRAKTFQQSIEPGQLPITLTELKLHSHYRGIIVPGSIPLNVKNLNLKFNSDGNKVKLSKYPIPLSTTNLEFDAHFDQDLAVGTIPNNINTIKNFNGDIVFGSLPISLRSIEFGISFNRSIPSYVLPQNLTYIDMAAYNKPLVSNLFPISIKSIKMDSFNQQIPDGYFNNYKNLTTLECYDYNKKVTSETLPPSLTSLSLGWYYNGPLNDQVLPKSLTTLILDNPNYKSLIVELPSSITSLELHSCISIELIPLPCNLKELYLTNPKFNQDITSNGTFKNTILPQSLKHIYFNENNVNYINSLDLQFLLKYIRFINK